MNGLWNQNDWSQLLEGDPGTLETRSGALSRQATAINDAAQALQDIVSGQLSKSTTALRSTAAELQTSMSQAYLRYDETATALRTYAVTLAPIKEQAARTSRLSKPRRAGWARPSTRPAMHSGGSGSRG